MKITGVTSDTHFGHANIILYANRPFVNVKTDLDEHGKWISKAVATQRASEMDDALVEGYNSVATGPDDVILHLGDVFFSPPERILCRLNGTLLFVKGNHDKRILTYLRRNPTQEKVKCLGDIAEVDLDGNLAIVCHYALRVWNKAHYGSWNLYGHSHDSLEELDTAKSIDVGVDAAFRRFGQYRPFWNHEIEEIMDTKNFIPVDHHVSG